MEIDDIYLNGADMKTVTLKGIQEFYASEFLNNIYTYQFMVKDSESNNDGIASIKLEFQESNMCHLLGIQHIVDSLYNKNTYVGQAGYDKIFSLEVDINTFKSISKSKFKNQKDRIKFFKYMKYIVENPDIILYNSDISKSNIESKYILYKLIGTNYVHIGIDVNNSKDSIDFCYPRTFLIEKKEGRKFIDGQTELIVLEKDISLKI